MSGIVEEVRPSLIGEPGFEWHRIGNVWHGRFQGLYPNEFAMVNAAASPATQARFMFIHENDALLKILTRGKRQSE
jgi:hypothetical protein